MNKNVHKFSSHVYVLSAQSLMFYVQSMVALSAWNLNTVDSS